MPKDGTDARSAMEAIHMQVVFNKRFLSHCEQRGKKEITATNELSRATLVCTQPRTRLNFN